MRRFAGLVLVGGLAACAAPAPVVAPTPDRQESEPVTRVIHSYFYEDGDDLWSADIMREALGEPGSIKVIGPGPTYRAQFFAAKACIEDGGTFRPEVQPEERPLPTGPNKVFLYELVCE